MKTIYASYALAAFAVYGVVADDPENGKTETGKLGDAAAITNNPTSTYSAQWRSTENRPFSGSVVALGAPDGKGVVFTVNFENLPDEGGPFSFHIHDQPVPESGNCNGTLAHLDPYQRGQVPPCNREKPQTCEVGDLSGKHGKIEGTSVEDLVFRDMYASTATGIGAFFGNRSVVIHFANTTRFACANFTEGGLKRRDAPLPGPEVNGRRWLSVMKAWGLVGA